MPENVQELRQQIASLERRLERLEQLARAQGQTLAEPVAEPRRESQTPSGSVPAEPPPRLASQPPAFSKPQATVVARSESLESKIGSQWFNRIGIVAVLIGISLGLKYAFENNWIGPGGRIAIGLLAGIAVVFWSERFRGRGYLIFSWSLKAVGIGTLYLSLWAGFQVYHLFPAEVGFAAMVVVTACTAILALAQNAQVLAAFALIGGFATPILLSTGQNREVVLFSYVALLDAATAVLISVRPWRRLLIGSYVGTLILYVGWYWEYYSRAQLGTTIAFATLFFVIFVLAPVFAAKPAEVSSRPSLTLLVLPLVNAGVYFFQMFAMLEAISRIALAWIAVGLAVVYLVLSRYGQMRRQAQENARVLNLIYIALAVGFLTAAIPLQLQTHWITFGWLVEATMLLWISYRAPSLFLRTLAAIALALGIARLLVWDDFHTEQLIFNARFGLYLVAIAALGFGVILVNRYAPVQDKNHAQAERAVAAVAVVVLNVLALLALNFEVHDYFARELANMRQLRGHALPWVDVRQFAIVRQFAYSAVWMGYGAALMWVGFWKRSAFLRWQALVLIAVTVVKVFTYDVSQLERGYRVLSFIALGILLLAVSFIYQRDWLRLSGRHKTASHAEGGSPA